MRPQAPCVCNRLHRARQAFGDVIPVPALPAVLRDSGAARRRRTLQPVDQGPAFWLARKGLPHGRSRQSSEGPQRSIHVSSTPDRRKNSAAAMVNPHIRARAPTTTVTYDDRTLGPFPASPPVSVRYRQGRDRPCAGLRWPRTVNRGRRPLAMPSKLLPTPHSAVAAGLDIQGPRFARKRLPRARSPAAVKPLRGSFAPLRPCG